VHKGVEGEEPSDELLGPPPVTEGRRIPEETEPTPPEVEDVRRPDMPPPFRQLGRRQSRRDQGPVDGPDGRPDDEVKFDAQFDQGSVKADLDGPVGRTAAEDQGRRHRRPPLWKGPVG
jgi:hypothetical protein